MICDPIIYWMAHVGEGSWAGFKRAVASLPQPPDGAPMNTPLLRTRLSDLGVAEFFVGGTERWQALHPLLVASPHHPSQAFLSGVHTPTVVERLRTSAGQAGCRLLEAVVDRSFKIVRIYGTNLREVADRAGVPFEADAGRRLACGLTPLEDIIRAAKPEKPPHGWTVRSFDLQTKRWVVGVLPGTASEYTSRYQERSYYLEMTDGQFLRLPKREAVFAAAWMSRIPVARYDVSHRELSTPVEAPLPEAYARAACVGTAGSPSISRRNEIVYEHVPPHLAATLLAGLGHLPPRFHFCRDSVQSRGSR